MEDEPDDTALEIERLVNETVQGLIKEADAMGVTLDMDMLTEWKEKLIARIARLRKKG